MFFVLSKSLSFLIHPLIWICIVLLFALIVKKQKLKKLFLWLAFGLFFLFGNEWFVDRFMNRWEYAPKPFHQVSHHDYGIVLTGMGSYHHTSKRLHFYDESDRFIQAVTLYYMGRIDTIILSGGSGRISNPDYKESSMLNAYLLHWGVPESHILIEPASRNTYENARNTVQRFYHPNKSYLLITSAFHMQRAKDCFIKQGLRPSLFPTGPNQEHAAMELYYYLLPRVASFQKWNILLKEWTGYVVYGLMGYL